MNERGRASWLPRAATVLAILSCYGTTLIIGLLSALGISLAVDERAWAGAISILAALAAVAIAASCRRRGSIGPAAIAAVGLVLILWVMYGSYDRIVELAGFALLVVAALWDWRAGASAAAVDEVSWIEPGGLCNRLERDPKPVIVDVRTPDEFTGPLGHIATARNLPMTELTNRLREIDAVKDKPVILVCRTDKRSAAASTLLRNAGFRDVKVLRGGMERWSQERQAIAGRLGQR